MLFGSFGTTDDLDKFEDDTMYICRHVYGSERLNGGPLPKKGAPFLPNFEIYPLIFLPILKIFRISTRYLGIFSKIFCIFSKLISLFSKKKIRYLVLILEF